MISFGAFNYDLVRKDSLLSVSLFNVHPMPDIARVDLRADESRIVRHVKPSHCGEAHSKPRPLNWDRTQTIAALAHGFNR